MLHPGRRSPGASANPSRRAALPLQPPCCQTWLSLVDHWDTLRVSGPEGSIDAFRVSLREAIGATAVPQLLATGSRQAVVLERIARGAGATRRFLLGDIEDLVLLEQRLSPGSLVSFYFDGRLAGDVYGPAVAEAVLGIARKDGDAVIGRVEDAELELDVEFVAGHAELEQYASALGQADVIYGRFPAADNDGERAVTITLPDRDGVIRPHPH